MRSCPRCTWPLTLYRHQDIELDHCSRCGGTFLDPGEASTLFGEAAEPDQWKEEYNARMIGPSKLRCAANKHAILEAYEVKFGSSSVEVDVCPRCRGLWLDRNEGTRLYNLVVGAREHAKNKELGIDRPGLGSYVFQLLTGFPVEVWNPVKKKPVVVYSLVAILTALFIFEMTGQAWQKYLLCVPAEIRQGRQLWTVITCGFFHGGFAHIFGNLYFLWIFGDNVEDSLGKARFLALYGVSLIAGSTLHVLFNLDSTIPMLGASGAIAGLMGAYLVMFPKVKMWVVMFFVRFRVGVTWYLGLWIGYQLLMSALGGHGVAWFAHIGGFIAGAAIAWILKSDPDEVVRV